MLWFLAIPLFLSGRSAFAESSVGYAYDCAKSVASLLEPEDQLGPMFVREDLVFTSLEANDGSRFLIVDAGTGPFTLPLVKLGLNRIRFELPSRVESKRKIYFLTYLHDNVSFGRVLDFASEHLPMGKRVGDYKWVTPTRAQGLSTHFDYNIRETAEELLVSLTDGKLSRSQLRKHKIESCGQIAMLKRRLDVVEMIVMGATIAGAPSSSSRAPASVVAAPHN